MSTRNRPSEDETIPGAAPHMAGDTTAASPARERIESRAYEIYCERGRTDGQADDDWLRAERELRNDRESNP